MDVTIPYDLESTNHLRDTLRKHDGPLQQPYQHLEECAAELRDALAAERANSGIDSAQEDLDDHFTDALQKLQNLNAAVQTELLRALDTEGSATDVSPGP